MKSGFGRWVLNLVVVALVVWAIRWISDNNFQDMVIGLLAMIMVEIGLLQDRIGDIVQ
jgi:hypothetical protein